MARCTLNEFSNEEIAGEAVSALKDLGFDYVTIPYGQAQQWVRRNKAGINRLCQRVCKGLPENEELRCTLRALHAATVMSQDEDPVIAEEVFPSGDSKVWTRMPIAQKVWSSQKNNPRVVVFKSCDSVEEARNRQLECRDTATLSQVAETRPAVLEVEITETLWGVGTPRMSHMRVKRIPRRSYKITPLGKVR